MPASYAEVIQDAVQMVTCKMASRLNEQIFVTLSDHLIYALERYKRNRFTKQDALGNSEILSERVSVGE